MVTECTFREGKQRRAENGVDRLDMEQEAELGRTSEKMTSYGSIVEKFGVIRSMVHSMIKVCIQLRGFSFWLPYCKMKLR